MIKKIIFFFSLLVTCDVKSEILNQKNILATKLILYSMCSGYGIHQLYDDFNNDYLNSGNLNISKWDSRFKTFSYLTENYLKGADIKEFVFQSIVIPSIVVFNLLLATGGGYYTYDIWQKYK